MIFVEEKPVGFPSNRSIKQMADYFYGRGIPDDLSPDAEEYLVIASTTAGKKIREAIQLYEFTLQTGIKAKLNYGDHGPDAMVVGDYPEHNVKDGTLIELKEEHPNEDAAGSFLNYKHNFKDLSVKRVNLYKKHGLIFVGFGRNGSGVYMVAMNMIGTKDFDKMIIASKNKERKKRKIDTAPSNIANLLKAVLYQDKPEYFKKKTTTKNSSFYYYLKFEQIRHDIENLESNLPSEYKDTFTNIIKDAQFLVSDKKCKSL